MVLTWVLGEEGFVIVVGLSGSGKTTFLAVFILLVIAGAGTANSILIAAYKRRKEIRSFDNYGNEAKEVRKMFLLEEIIL